MNKLKPIILPVIILAIIFSFMIKQPIQNLDEIWNYSFSKNISDGLVPYKDFNLVQTPFLFMIVAIFLKIIFNGIIMTRILGAILATSILVMIYLVLSKLVKNKYINLFIVLNICIIMIPFFCLDYNFLVLLFALIILNYELRFKNKELLSLNIKNDFLIGILAGIAIITKQSTGLFVATCYVLYKWLAIKNKEDIILAFKISLSRGLGVLVPIIIFLCYLFITGSFNEFLNFCVFGVSEFSNSIPYTKLLTEKYYDINVKILAIGVPITILYTLIYLIKNYKFNTLESKNILKLFLFGIASFVVAFPISDSIHFLIGSIILIILDIYIIATHLEINKKDKVNINKRILKIDKIELEKNINRLVKYLVYIIFGILIIVMCYNYYKYFTNNEKSHNIAHYEGIIISDGLVSMINELNEYRKLQMENGNNTYIINADAACYNIPFNIYNKYFDLLLKGNLGKNGSQVVIEKIKSLEENGMFIVLNENYPLNWQVPLDVIKYIRDNYNKVYNIGAYDVYSYK